MELAVERGDLVLAHKLINVIFDSYFDILFALNRELHPGTKRQLMYADALPIKPRNMVNDVQALSEHQLDAKAVMCVKHLIDELEHLLKSKKYI